MNMKNNNKYLLLLHDFSSEHGVNIGNFGSKVVGNFNVKVESDLLNKTYYNVPIRVVNKGSYGALAIEWDDYGFANYSDYGLYETYGTGYYDFAYTNEILIIFNDNLKISIE